jgi:adenosylcobinamide-GDP ribazoletransferase
VAAFAAAIQFLLVSPAFVRRAFTPKELGAATGYYPLVGVLLGSLLAAVDVLLASIYPAQLRSALVLAMWIVLTGALHLDGFLDTCDGLLGGATARRRMAIMRDERAGAFALAGGGLMLITMFSALAAIEEARWAALLLAPVLGRCGMTLAIVVFPYGRRTGLGRDIKDHAGVRHAVGASLTALVVVGAFGWGLHSLAPAAALVCAAAVWGLASAFILRRVPGMTGDTYGALNMLVETTTLLTLAAMA